MRPLSSNTLIDISRHSNKTIKLIDFLIKTGQPLLISSLGRIDSESDNIDLIEAFHDDLQKTASQAVDVFQLLSTVDNEDNVLHLDNEQKNLSVLFGKDYDPEWKAINFSSFELNLKTPVSKTEIMSQIVRNSLGISYSEYEKLYKARKTIYKVQEDSLYTEDDKVEFLSVLKDQDYYRDCIEKIRGYAIEYSTFRQALTVSDRSKIDNEITFSRAMVDSVTKQSTYITKEDGVVQLASKHKKNIHIDRLVDVLSSSRYVKGIELDQKTDIQAIINLIEQTNQINFNLENEVVFKARALGNYNANGLYSDAYKIVAVDIKNPSACIHEFVHAVDYSKSDINHSQVREDIAHQFRQKIDASLFTDRQAEYYLSTVEIIARLGEIGFLLNKHDYKEGEAIDDFIKRVAIEEVKDHKYDINLVKPISVYAESRRDVFFDLPNWTQEEALLVKEYYQCYFGVENRPVREISAAPVVPNVARKLTRAKATRYKVLPVGLFNSDNVRYALDYNLEKGLLDTRYLLEELFAHPAHLNRTSKSYKTDSVLGQQAVYTEVANWIKEKDDPYLYSIAAEFVTMVYCWNQDAPRSLGLMNRDINYDSTETYKKYITPISEKLEESKLYSAKMQECSEKLVNPNLSQDQRSEIMRERNEWNDKRWMADREVRSIKTDFFVEKADIIKDLFPEANTFKEINDGIWTANWRDDGQIHSRIKSSALGKIVSPIRSCVEEGIEKHGVAKISSYWGPESITPHLLATKASSQKFLGNAFEKHKSEVITGMLANGSISTLLEHKKSRILDLKLSSSLLAPDDYEVVTYQAFDVLNKFNSDIKVEPSTLESEVYKVHGDPEIDSFWVKERVRIKDTYSAAEPKPKIIQEKKRAIKADIGNFIEKKKSNEKEKPKNDKGQLGFDF